MLLPSLSPRATGTVVMALSAVVFSAMSLLAAVAKGHGVSPYVTCSARLAFGLVVAGAIFAASRTRRQTHNRK